MTRLPIAVGLLATIVLGSISVEPDPAQAVEGSLLGSGPVAGGTQVTFGLPEGLRFSSFLDSAGSRFAVSTSGQLYAWGNNDNGELGDGTSSARTIPTPISGSLEGLSVVRVHNAGDTTYAIDSSGDVHAWGLNSNGQLGDGSTISRSTPSRVLGIPNGVSVETVRSSDRSAYAITTDGRLFAWGNNSSGRLGDGTTINRSLPVEITGFADGAHVVDLIVGFGHAYALTSDGGVYAWGINSSGVLGDGTTTSRSSPTLVFSMTEGDQEPRLQSIGLQTFLLTRSGEVYSWGANGEGILGNGTSDGSTVPTQIQFPRSSSISRLEVPFAISANGELFGWGPNLDGILGDGSMITRTSPVSISGFPESTGVAQISVSRTTGQAVALTTSGKVFAWGQNDDGQVGDGTRVDRLTPVPIAMTDPTVTFGHVEAVSRGAFAVSSDGTLYAWGDNSFGRLGIGFALRATSPSTVETYVPVDQLFVDSLWNGFALSSTGELAGWGYAPVGNGSNLDARTPEIIDGVEIVDVFFGEVEASQVSREAADAIVTSPPNQVGFVDVILEVSIAGEAMTPLAVGHFEYGIPPTITTEPQSATTETGSTAVFTAEATGGQPMSATWFRVITPNSAWQSVLGGTVSTSTVGTVTTSSISLPATIDLSGTQYLVRFTNRFGDSESQTVDLAVQQAEWVTTPTPVIEGQAVPGRPLSPSLGQWSPEPQSFSYRWLRNGSPVATSVTYVVQPSDVGQSISLEVSAARTGYTEVTRTSVPVIIRELGDVERWAGSNRFETSARISAESQDPGVPVVFIANGANFPDALSGAAVAGQLGGPVLLSTSTTLPPAIITELQRLNPARIVILGGTGVISPAVETQLDAYTTGDVDRWAGSNRFETSARISAESQDPGVPVVFIANGANFPDALSGAAVAGQLGGPVLLSTSTTLPPAIITELQRLNPARIVILGGTGVIANSVQVQLDSL